MPMIITKYVETKYGPRVFANCDGGFGSWSKWNPAAHEETNHAAAMRRLAHRNGWKDLAWNGARYPNKPHFICWIAASGQRFTATT